MTSDLQNETGDLGQALAGTLIATTLFRVLIEKGLLTRSDGTAILNRAIAAVEHSTTANELAALNVLRGLYRQLHS